MAALFLLDSLPFILHFLSFVRIACTESLMVLLVEVVYFSNNLALGLFEFGACIFGHHISQSLEWDPSARLIYNISQIMNLVNMGFEVVQRDIVSAFLALNTRFGHVVSVHQMGAILQRTGKILAANATSDLAGLRVKHALLLLLLFTGGRSLLFFLFYRVLDGHGGHDFFFGFVEVKISQILIFQRD